MEKYKLLIFPSAIEDLQGIVDYVNGLSADAAIKLYDEIVEKIGTLSQMPQRCGKNSRDQANSFLPKAL